MSIPNPRESERGPRYSVLMRLAKPRVVGIWKQLHPHAWTASPVTSWTKEELVSDILSKEIGERELCGAKEPTGDHVCSIGAHVLHETHRYDLDVKEITVKDGNINGGEAETVEEVSLADLVAQALGAQEGESS